MDVDQIRLVLALFLSLVSAVCSVTDPNDLAILNQFRQGLENPELLNWPTTGSDPCGPPTWKHIVCAGNRVSQIQVQNLGLKGPLPNNLNQLTKLSNLGLQKNQFSGMLPSLGGLSELEFAFLDYNSFDSIPLDFFDGLVNLQILALDSNPLNATTGWSLPYELQSSAQLATLSLMNCNLAGPLPEFLGNLLSLKSLKLALNRISGGIPTSFSNLGLQYLWLNGQSGGGMNGPIDVVASIVSLASLWLHGNEFSGKIPENIGDLTSLKDFNVNSNDLVGLLPDSLADMQLNMLDLNNNQFMGPVPEVKAVNYSYSSNNFCQSDVGGPCAPEVMALLEFLDGLNYPSRLVSSWSGNDPCEGQWLGVSCDANQKVAIVNLAKYNLSGTLSPSLANLGSLTQIKLSSNHLSGPIPTNWTTLKSLTLLDVSGNILSAPLPKFSNSVKLVLDSNPLLNSNQSEPTPSPGNIPPSGGSQSPSKNPSPPIAGSTTNRTSPSNESTHEGSSKRSKLVVIVAVVASMAALIFFVVPLSIYCCKKRKDTSQAPTSLAVQPRDPSYLDNMVKIVVANNANGSVSTLMGSGCGSRNSSAMGESNITEARNLIISVQVLRNVTKNFAPENELGRGGFGVVYKGELDDGTKIAVKRMEASVISSKALDEFQAEIAVLSKVRHRHLVSLLGYSIGGNERILVYEYMPQGTLSKHLFHWKSLRLEPLSWKRRLNIALDVARGMEYLHSMAYQSFIHRDLKPSNILLGDDFRAKVSDFGLVKLAPNGEKSVVTRLAGTFGYLAPEYAVMGKITTKADVFSFGVVLMELLTGLTALDEDRPEESQYLAAWFWKIKSSQEKLMAAIDPALDVKDGTFESISVIAELAGHCTAREPSQRPDMGHAVNVLSPLVEKWKPLDNDTEEYCGIDYSLPLNQMVKGWQEAEGKDLSYLDLKDSKGSISSRPTGFAESFLSTDGR
ncbi:receptor-like kinase TMK3 [Actinidia eriantha]|uniref:receptor-like kinase TMK3 n=1 Tax=Actinidia eriantha TaxID=165200 RepID=UPI002588B242|nr:receptor-like kinase TMK3 [Actinidia eriantha]